MAVAYNDERRDSSSSKRRKKKKMQIQFNNDKYQFLNKNEITSWKSEERKQVYSSKLLRVLWNVRLGSGSGSGASARGRVVHEAADRVLAMTAKGRSRWSRAILANKLKRKCKFRSRNLRQRGVIATNRRKPIGVGILRLKSPSTVQRKARDLGRLVPGCRKQELSVVLEEATDYIAALEMQVKAMAALAELFSDRSGFGAGAVNSSRLAITQPPPSS